MLDSGNAIIKNKIKQFSNLPTLSVIQSKLVKTISRPNASVEEIVEIIRHDPALSTKVVAVANSPFFGRSGRVESLEKAIMMVGFDFLKGIALGICIFGFFPQTKALRGMWAHSYAVATLAGILARRMGSADPNSAFLAGLLHDVGRSVFMKIYAEEQGMQRSTEIFDLKGEELLQAEIESLFCDHSQAGRWFLESLTFAKDVIEPVGMHHGPGEKIGSSGLVPVVYLAEGMMGLFSPDLAGDGEWTGQHQRIFAECGLKDDDKESIVKHIKDEEASIRRFFDL
ncbi:MAG TPA: HDOD domain-containing protein [Dissulfurispiraceae bacterium]|nr:HDOD domain-containing protein [Dissulfurispiraceae bacterium]